MRVGGGSADFILRNQSGTVSADVTKLRGGAKVIMG
jgi:hypothetical protein